MLFVIAVGCGLAASIGVSQYMETAGAGTHVETAKILVAMTDIGINQKLDAQNIKLEEWPKDRVPEGAISDLKELDGKYPKSRMYAGEPILNAKLTGANQNTAVNTIPKGYRAVPVKVSAETTGRLIQPGDRVDVLVMLRKSSEVPETGTRTILRDVNVFSVDGATERSVDETGNARNVNTVLLLLRPKQAEAVTLASELGRLFLTLRRPDDDVEDLSDGETVQSLLGSSGENANENNPDNGGGFTDWLHRAVTKVEPVPTQALAPQPAPEAPKWKMVILGSNGSQEYHWMDENELPIEGAFGTPNSLAPAGSSMGPSTAATGLQNPSNLRPGDSPLGEDQEDDVEQVDSGEQAIAPQ